MACGIFWGKQGKFIKAAWMDMGLLFVLGYKTRGLLQKSASRDRARESIENLKFWYTSSNNNNKAAQGSVAYAPARR